MFVIHYHRRRQINTSYLRIAYKMRTAASRRNPRIACTQTVVTLFMSSHAPSSCASVLCVCGQCAHSLSARTRSCPTALTSTSEHAVTHLLARSPQTRTNTRTLVRHAHTNACRRACARALQSAVHRSARAHFAKYKRAHPLRRARARTARAHLHAQKRAHAHQHTDAHASTLYALAHRRIHTFSTHPRSRA